MIFKLVRIMKWYLKIKTYWMKMRMTHFLKTKVFSLNLSSKWSNNKLYNKKCTSNQRQATLAKTISRWTRKAKRYSTNTMTFLRLWLKRKLEFSSTSKVMWKLTKMKMLSCQLDLKVWPLILTSHLTAGQCLLQMISKSLIPSLVNRPKRISK